MIIVKENGNRVDGDLCCEHGHSPLWQPEEKNPCQDDWWCRECGAWTEGFIRGPHALQVGVTPGDYECLGPTPVEFVCVCCCPSGPTRWCNQFQALMRRWYLAPRREIRAQRSRS